MATYDLRQKTHASSGQKISYLGGGLNPLALKRVQNLEDKVASQGDKLDHIVKLLNELSEKKSTSWDNSRIQVW